MPTLSNKVDVLVVGAGPVGLLTALSLAEAGIEVEIIDRAWRSSAQSYACGLHASTVDLLARLGLEKAAFDVGRRVETLAFFQGTERRAELRFAGLSGQHPYLMVLPQDRLEELLELELRRRGVRVRWGHRLDDLRQDENAVVGVVEKLAVTSVGYPFARSEEMVQSAVDVRARYLVGADGAPSHVRHLLGIGTETFGPAAAYEVFEFEPASDAGSEVRVVVGSHTADVFWPQPGSVCRWSFEVDGIEAEKAEKDRESGGILNEETDASDRRELEERLRHRAPWYQAGVKMVDWRTVVGFERMSSASFGRGRCWLAGDAAHQTSPVGMQSMNVGLREAMDLAERITRILRGASAEGPLAEYDQERRAEWTTLLSGKPVIDPSRKGSGWAQENRARLLACVPGSGAELSALLGQLGLRLG